MWGCDPRKRPDIYHPTFLSRVSFLSIKYPQHVERRIATATNSVWWILPSHITGGILTVQPFDGRANRHTCSIQHVLLNFQTPKIPCWFNTRGARMTIQFADTTDLYILEFRPTATYRLHEFSKYEPTLNPLVAKRKKQNQASDEILRVGATKRREDHESSRRLTLWHFE